MIRTSELRQWFDYSYETSNTHDAICEHIVAVWDKLEKLIQAHGVGHPYGPVWERAVIDMLREADWGSLAVMRARGNAAREAQAASLPGRLRVVANDSASA